MRLILTRHHQTISNAQGKILGWSDSPPNKGWQKDVDFIVGQLTDAGIRPDHILASELPRAQRTARAYGDAFGITRIIFDAALKEVNYGVLQGREKWWVYENYPDHKVDPDMVYPQGESFRQMRERCVARLTAEVRANPQSTLLVVSHAGAIRSVISHFVGVDYAASLKQRIPFRFLGTFLFEGQQCIAYDELGEPSGFVTDGVIKLPHAAVLK